MSSQQINLVFFFGAIDIIGNTGLINCTYASQFLTYSGADYGLGTIGTCLGPPPLGGAPI